MSETSQPEAVDSLATSVLGESESESQFPHVYRSALDWWVGVLLAFPILVAAAIGVVLMANGRPADASTMFLVAAATLLVTTVFVVPCRYTFLADALSIRCGLICYQVPYASIRDVKRSSTLRSGPALSLSRVVIQTDQGEYIVSPVQREKFIEHLRSRSPL